VNVIIIYMDVINPGPVNDIIHVNVIIIYSDIRNPDFVNDIIYVNVIIIFIAILFIFPLMFKTDIFHIT
jgi:hypothetical protein